MILARRSLLFGAGAALLAAPAIVRVATHLMPVKPLPPALVWPGIEDFNRLSVKVWSERLVREAIKASAVQQRMIVSGDALDALISVKLRMAA